MRATLAWLSLAGLLASLWVHVAAISGVDMSIDHPAVWMLHIGIFVVFFPFVLFSRRDYRKRTPSFAEMRRDFPVWVLVLGGAAFAYAAIYFAWCIHLTEGGSPQIRDGHLVLMDHGRLIREITAEEYAGFKANEVRLFSGHWLVFYLMPAIYFTFRKPRESI